MQSRTLGDTGLRVSIVGLGTVQIGRPQLDDARAARVLNASLDAGITLIDTAVGYDLAEERIGKHLSHRRDEFVLSSKCGYGVAGVADWTADCITRGVEQSLQCLRTDRIDIMHLHSCPLDVLLRGDVIAALGRARQSGKIRVAAYSGENDALDHAIACGAFQSVQCSVNICDQAAIERALPQARQRGVGVLAKRPLANAFWRFETQPTGDYCEEYWRRARAMKLTCGSLSWTELAARFAAYQPGVDAIIVGSSNAAHVEEVIEFVNRGPLPADVDASLGAAFAPHRSEWSGQI
ncbi:MAG: aldo/keto reductase [Phycisphaerae bacterium]